MGYKNKICTYYIYIYPRFSIEQTWECLARFARSPISVLHKEGNDV